MAEESDAAGGLAPVDDDAGIDWTCSLTSVERITAEDGDAEDDIFAVEFQVDGPDVNGDVEVIVSDFPSEAEVVAVALGKLHAALGSLGQVTAGAVGRAAARPTVAQEPGGPTPAWSVALGKVERLPTDDPEEQGDRFRVAFKAEGLNVSAEVQVIVDDVGDETRVVAEALDALGDGLDRWALAVALRAGEEPPVEPNGA